MADEILTGKQVAEIFGVHPQTVVKWANEGRLPYWRTPGQHRRFREADVRRLKQSLTAEPGLSIEPASAATTADVA
jgi:excisionase family DNA binding protein